MYSFGANNFHLIYKNQTFPCKNKLYMVHFLLNRKICLIVRKITSTFMSNKMSALLLTFSFYDL